MEQYKVTDAPLGIWLNYGELEHDDTHDSLHREDGQITWCDIQIDSSDVKYVRADEIVRLTKQRDELAKALEQCRDALDIAFEYDSDVFGVHHNSAVDALIEANSVLDEVKGGT